MLIHGRIIPVGLLLKEESEKAKWNQRSRFPLILQPVFCLYAEFAENWGTDLILRGLFIYSKEVRYICTCTCVQVRV